MRNRFLVCYDVINPKRLARTYKKMNGFGEPAQYSVFICDLSPKEWETPANCHTGRR